MAIGHAGDATACSGIWFGPQVAGAADYGAQPKVALGLMLAARDDFAQLAAHSSAAIRLPLHHPARARSLEGDEPLGTVLARGQKTLPGLQNGRAVAETTFGIAKVTVHAPVRVSA